MVTVEQRPEGAWGETEKEHSRQRELGAETHRFYGRKGDQGARERVNREGVVKGRDRRREGRGGAQGPSSWA